jgi:hypothetical protein
LIFHAWFLLSRGFGCFFENRPINGFDQVLVAIFGEKIPARGDAKFRSSSGNNYMPLFLFMTMSIVRSFLEPGSGLKLFFNDPKASES